MNDLPAILDDPRTAPGGNDAARAAQSCVTRQRLQEFARLPTGWAGDRTIPPRRETLAGIDRLLDDLPKAIALPHASASGDGEIGLTWYRNSDRFSATASPEGHLVWVSKIGDEYHDGGILMLASPSFEPFLKALADFFRE